MTRHGRVMLIDDEVALVDILTRLLSPDHDVVGFTDAREALARLASDRDFDVIVCDLMMPQLSSSDFFAELHTTAPELVDRVVFMTGGAFTSAAQQFLASVSNPRLQKPFLPSELTKLVQDLVARRDAERQTHVAVA
jgi:CheY-like chemotaxis protein